MECAASRKANTAADRRTADGCRSLEEHCPFVVLLAAYWQRFARPDLIPNAIKLEVSSRLLNVPPFIAPAERATIISGF